MGKFELAGCAPAEVPDFDLTIGGFPQNKAEPSRAEPSRAEPSRAEPSATRGTDVFAPRGGGVRRGISARLDGPGPGPVE
ncbi:MAG: hypothetical protein F4X09_07590 [Gammaproteobacteria bacterium]|nr:hypothetical protein [Gammaproteobacteria bacterium]MYH84483.1 hypothetical protein [Gammaproteobacteria bacterium]MYK05690.1 hypothetical protein [Gammaproteobacteria bacterium]